MEINPSHIVYTANDFTLEEYIKHNIIAVMVIDDGKELCKICGGSGKQLKETCQTIQHNKRFRRCTI